MKDWSKWYLLTIIFLYGVPWMIPLAIDYPDVEIQPFLLRQGYRIEPEIYVNGGINQITRLMIVVYLYWQKRTFVHLAFVFCFVFFTAQYFLHYNSMYEILTDNGMTSHLFVFLIFAWVCIKDKGHDE